MTSENFMMALYSICMIVLVILWLQSGFDKVTDFKGNYDWLKGQFSKSPVKGMVKFMLITLTMLELSSGLAALGAIIDIWFLKTWYLPFIACFLSMLSLVALFFGQRISKEYGGAASLTGYMVYVVLLIFFTVELHDYVLYTTHFPVIKPSLF
jgi:predicted small integral membrane protein